MDRIRYYLGVVILILVPLGLLYWLIIHGWAGWWRRWGPARTYLAVLPVLAALGVLLFTSPNAIPGLTIPDGNPMNQKMNQDMNQ